MERKFRIAFRETEGDGEFNCPSCGTTISPDDRSGLTYCILDVKTKADGDVKEIVVQCGKCGAIICLDEFDSIEDSSCSECSNAKEYLSSLKIM